ncbi:MAG: hypothetical protein NUV67_00955, partial [archaeon]|nr:hypothetical protein [archaeon]
TATYKQIHEILGQRNIKTQNSVIERHWNILAAAGIVPEYVHERKRQPRKAPVDYRQEISRLTGIPANKVEAAIAAENIAREKRIGIEAAVEIALNERVHRPAFENLTVADVASCLKEIRSTLRVGKIRQFRKQDRKPPIPRLRPRRG